MARLFGVSLQDNHKVDYALTKIYGVGWTTSKYVLTQTQIDPQKRVKDLSEEDLQQLTGLIEKNYRIEGLLREELNESSKRLRDIKCYRGMRYMLGLPSRGQRTRSNARTRRGKRRTVGALKKEAWAKLESQQKQAKK